MSAQHEDGMQVFERDRTATTTDVRPTSASVVRRTGVVLRRGTRDPLLWFVLAAATFLLANSITQLTVPVSRDEGTFLVIAQGVLHGHLPYRDVFDQKGPAIYYVLAAILAVTSHLPPIAQVLIIRVLVALVNLVTAGGIVALGRRWWRLEVGVLAAGLWLAALPLYEGEFFVTEPFAIAATVWALVVAVYRPGRYRAVLASGLLLALATLFKQTAVLAAPGVGLVVLTGERADSARRHGRDLLLRGATFVAALAVPWLLVFALWAVAGGLGALWNQVVLANLLFYRADPSVAAELTLARDYLPLLWLAPIVVGAVGLARWIGLPAGTRQPPSVASLALWLIGGLGLTPFRTHAYLHYWLQVLPSAVLLAALGAFSILDAWRPQGNAMAGRRAARIAAPLLLALFVTLVGWRGSIPDLVASNSALLRQQAAAGEWIAQRTAAGDRILVLPAEPEYYFLAGRPPSTSYIYVLPINETDALVAQIEQQLGTRTFGAVIWQEGGVPTQSSDPLYQTLSAHYQLVATEPTERLELWQANP